MFYASVTKYLLNKILVYKIQLTNLNNFPDTTSIAHK